DTNAYDLSLGNVMATINKLSKLFSALADQNVHRAEEIAAEIASEEERKGHHSAAKLLRGSLHPNGANGGIAPNSWIPQTTFSRLLSEALSPQQVSTRLAQVALRRAVRSELESIGREWRHQSEL